MICASRFSLLLCAVGLTFTAALSACHSSSPTSSKTGGGVVAHIGNEVITADELKAQLGQQPPFLQARYRDATHKKEFLQGLIRTDVLAQAAVREGIDKTPEVAAGIRKLLAQEMIKRAFDEKQKAIDDEATQTYFNAHREEFVKPEKIRIQQIFLAAPVGAKAEEKAARTRAKAKGVELLTKLKTAPGKGTPIQFADLARQFSNDPATRDVGGDTRYLSQEEMTRQYSADLAKAAFALTKPEQLADLIETPAGFHVVKFTNRQAGVDKTSSDPQVRETIRGALAREQRTKGFDEYVEKLIKSIGVSIDDAALNAVEPPNPTTTTTAASNAPPSRSSLTAPNPLHPLGQ